MNVGDIVQINPEMEVFGGCLAVVDEIKNTPGRVRAYIQDAGQEGQAYVFLNQEEYEPTGGRAVWIVGSEE